MKRIVLIFSVLPFLFFTYPEWLTFKLNEKVQVSMPGVPVETMISTDIKKLEYKWEDSTTVGGLVNDFAKFNLTEETMPQVIDQIKKQMITAREGQGAKILSEKECKYKEWSCFEFVSSKTENNIEVIRTDHVVIYKTLLINLYYKKGQNAIDEKVRDQFFNSLVCN
ncbi:MAG: hypothetical protein JWN76_3077 [Chitinophagaceae bacterium]|nr:hypothetical protein [Chitinophagaceae bacterium]